MVQAIRIFGGALGETQGYIDCDIVGVSLDGAIELQEQGTTNTWSIDLDRLVQLYDDSLVYDLASVDDTAEDWGAIDDLESRYKASAASDKSHFVDAAQRVFKGAEQ